MASSMCAPSIGLVLQDFQNSSRIYGARVLSVYVLGYAFGPLIIAPLSELYGRLPVYHDEATPRHSMSSAYRLWSPSGGSMLYSFAMIDVSWSIVLLRSKQCCITVEGRIMT